MPSALSHDPSITVPGASTDNAIVIFDGTGVTGFGNSTILVDSGGNGRIGIATDTNIITLTNETVAVAGAITGVTALTVDNININGNTLSSTAGTDLFVTPLAGQQLILDGTIIIDAGVVTGATSITSTEFVGGGVGLTALNATQITSGTLPAARIGNDSIVEGKLNVSNAPTNGQVLTARSGVAGGFTWEAASAGGIDGTGVANKLAFWSDTDTLTQVATLQWNSGNHSLQLTRAGNVQIDMTPTGGSSVPYAISARTDGSLRFTNDTAGRIDMFVKSTGIVEFGNAIYIGRNNGSATNKSFGFHSKNTQSIGTSLAYIITAADGITAQGALIFVAGRESSGSTNKFYDLLMHTYRDTSSSPTVISSSNANSPSARTYDQNQSGLRLRMASGTYDVAVMVIEAPNVE